MTPDDSKLFLADLLQLSDYFGAEISPSAQTIYFEALSDFDITALRDVFRRAVLTCKFMPKVVELRELAEGSTEDRGQRAWTQVQHAATHVGVYRSLECEVLATAAALVRTFGTWERFCTVDLDPPMWASKRKEFLSNYRLAKREPPDASLRCLPGLAERHNRDTVAAWGAALGPVTQMRGVLRADGAVDLEPLVLDPSSGRLIEASTVPQLTGTVETAEGPMDVLQRLREATSQRGMAGATLPATRGVCASCGVTANDLEHKPECETVQAASAHEARVRAQAMTLAGRADWGA